MVPSHGLRFPGLSVVGLSSAAAAGLAAANLTAAQALAAAQALSHVYASTAAAQADGTLANGSFYTVANTSTGQLDLYSKTDASNSVFKFSLAQATQTNLNTAALAVLNETSTSTTFSTEPPAAADTWVDIWTTISNPGTRWTTSIVSGALQMVQTLASILLRGALRKDQQVAAGLWWYAEMTPATVTTQTSIGLLIAPDATGGGILDATHGHSITWRQDGAVVLYRGDGFTSVALSVPVGTPIVPFVAGNLVGLGVLINADDPTKGAVVQLINGAVVGGFTVSNLPTTGYIGAVVKQSANPITATLSKLTFHRTIKKSRYLYVYGAGGGSLGTEGSPYTTIQAGLLAAVDRPGEKLELIIKGGDYRLQTGLVIPTNRYREITIRCPSTERARIYGSTALTAGSASWTAASGTSHVWQNATGRTGSAVALIDLSHTVDMGTVIDGGAGLSVTPRSGFIAPYRTYVQLTSVGGSGGGLPTLATQKAACDATAGTFFNDATAGIVYVHPVGDVDANTLAWERCDAPNLLNVYWTAATDMNACRVNLGNLHFFGGYGQQVQLQRCKVDIENCLSEYCGVTDGWSLDTCHGLVASCGAQYNNNDGFHSNPIDTASVVRVPVLRFEDCFAQGQFLGDGWSNHELTEHALRQCRSDYNGKGGAAQCDSTRLHDCLFRHNTQAGLYLIGQSVRKLREMYVDDCEITDTPAAIVCQSFAGDTSRVYMRRGRIANTTGHAGVTGRRAVIDLSQNGGTSSIQGWNVRDGGNNGADNLGGPTTGTITWTNDSSFVS